MKSHAEKLLSDALQLDEADRAELAARLIASLDPAAAAAQQAWDTEIRRRLAELDSGTVKCIPWLSATESPNGGQNN